MCAEGLSRDGLTHAASPTIDRAVVPNRLLVAIRRAEQLLGELDRKRDEIARVQAEILASLNIGGIDVWPAIADQNMRRYGLADRQRDIAWLTLAGRENLQIADELCIEHSTVRNQLTQIYDKVGVSSRIELTLALLGVGPLDPEAPI